MLTAHESWGISSPDVVPMNNSDRRVRPGPGAPPAVAPGTTDSARVSPTAQTADGANHEQSPPESLYLAGSDCCVPSKYRITYARMQRPSIRHGLNLGAFLEVSLFLVALPLSVPVVLLTRGRAAVQNAGLWPTGWAFWAHTVHTALFIHVLVFLWGGNPQYVVVTANPMFVLIGSFVAIRVWLATQHAFLSAAEHTRRMTVVLSQEERDSYGVEAWLQMTHAKATQELREVQARLGVFLDVARFRCTKPHPQLNVDARSRVSVLQVLAHVLVSAGDMRLSRSIGLSFVITVPTIVQAVFLLSPNTDPRNLSGASPFEAWILGVYALLSFAQVLVVFVGLSFSIVDNRRRYESLQAYSSLFLELSEYDDQPCISLLDPENVHMFHMGRRVLYLVGQRYLQQWELTTSAIGVIWLAIVLMYIFANGYIPFAVVVVFTVNLAIPLAMATMYGSKANEQADRDQALLLSKAAEACEAQTYAQLQSKPHLADMYAICERLLRITGDSIAMDSQLNPVRIMGFKATDTFVRSAIVSLFSFLSLLQGLRLQ